MICAAPINSQKVNTKHDVCKRAALSLSLNVVFLILTKATCWQCAVRTTHETMQEGLWSVFSPNTFDVWVLVSLNFEQVNIFK